jgi:hypothetical protein
MGEARRTRSVGTKLTEEEYAKLEALAAQRGVTPGECVRDLVLGAFGESQPEATATEQALLSEVLALRTILINTVYDLASGEGMTPERMEKLSNHSPMRPAAATPGPPITTTPPAGPPALFCPMGVQPRTSTKAASLPSSIRLAIGKVS